jgi:Flp pilus assembly protein TadG
MKLVRTALRGSHSQGERAQGLVEFTLLVPFLLVLICGIIEFGWALRSHVVVTNATREGARYGVTCKTDSQIISRTEDRSSGLLTSSEPDDVQVLANPCSTGPYIDATYPHGGAPVQVTATYDHEYVTPLGTFVSMITGGGFPDPLPVSSTTTMRSE